MGINYYTSNLLPLSSFEFFAISFFESEVESCLCSAYAYAVLMLMHCLQYVYVVFFKLGVC